MKRSIVAFALVLFAAATASAQNGIVVQSHSLQCTDATYGFAYPANNWGPAPCVPPSPYDTVGKPNVGWGATGACTTGGSFDCAAGDTFDGMFPGSTGIGMADTNGSGTVTVTGTLTFVAGATLNGFIVPSATFVIGEQVKNIVLNIDGGIQLNSSVVGNFAIVDFSLQRVNSAGTATSLGTTRRVMVQNAVAQQSLANFTLNYIDRPPLGDVYTYRLASVLVANNAPVLTGDGLASIRIHMVGTQHLN
jgi:hypothetical protein